MFLFNSYFSQLQWAGTHFFNYHKLYQSEYPHSYIDYPSLPFWKCFYLIHLAGYFLLNWDPPGKWNSNQTRTPGRLCTSSNHYNTLMVLYFSGFRSVGRSVAIQSHCSLYSWFHRNISTRNIEYKPLTDMQRMEFPIIIRERGGVAVERRTLYLEFLGSIPTVVTVLCPWARHINSLQYWLNPGKELAPSRHNWKIVDWDVKPQYKQTNQHYHLGESTLIFRDIKCTFEFLSHFFLWNSSQQTGQPQMGCRILRLHIWGYIVCLCPIKRMTGL